MRHRLDGEVDNDLGVTRMVDAAVDHPIVDSHRSDPFSPDAFQTPLADEGKGDLASSPGG
jgi:hypothetical protein